MCEACEEYREASALLLMLINKIHATQTSGGARLRIDLANWEMDWLCAWGEANEDLEEDIPPEDDLPPEASGQLEADCRERFGPGETATAVVKPGGTLSIEPYEPA
jgi:hypothetical protein